MNLYTAMNLKILLLITTIFTVYTEEEKQYTMPPTVIPGDHSDDSCPTEGLARQNISAMIRRMISGTNRSFQKLVQVSTLI